MKAIRLSLMAAGALLFGGSIFMTSTFAGQNNGTSLQVIRHAGHASQSMASALNQSQVRATHATSEADQTLVLVPPPSELPRAASSNMVTSLKTFAPNSSRAVAAKKQLKVHKAPRQVAVQAAARKSKPENLFSYVRLLNYAPHPLSEEFLKKSPLDLNGKNYWFAVKYDEDWKVVNDEEGYIKALSFEISIMENNTVVRKLKTPKVKIDGKKLKKGMLLGVAEVAPYKFNIMVDEFKKNNNGVSELVFKLDLIG